LPETTRPDHLRRSTQIVRDLECDGVIREKMTNDIDDREDLLRAKAIERIAAALAAGYGVAWRSNGLFPLSPITHVRSIPRRNAARASLKETFPGIRKRGSAPKTEVRCWLNQSVFFAES